LYHALNIAGAASNDDWGLTIEDLLMIWGLADCAIRLAIGAVMD